LGRWSSSFACRSEFLSSWDPLASSPASNDLAQSLLGYACPFDHCPSMAASMFRGILWLDSYTDLFQSWLDLFVILG
jgi:hypothetical protein